MTNSLDRIVALILCLLMFVLIIALIPWGVMTVLLRFLFGEPVGEPEIVGRG